jgi:hypothetical protein
MRTIRAFLAEIIGLFVDDGSLALGLLLWCAAIGISTSLVPSLKPVGAPIWSVGCALILLGAVLRSARPQSHPAGARDGAGRVLTGQVAAGDLSFQYSRGDQP